MPTLKWRETVEAIEELMLQELIHFYARLGNPCPEKINGVEIRLGGRIKLTSPKTAQTQLLCS